MRLALSTAIGVVAGFSLACWFVSNRLARARRHRHAPLTVSRAWLARYHDGDDQ